MTGWVSGQYFEEQLSDKTTSPAVKFFHEECTTKALIQAITGKVIWTI